MRDCASALLTLLLLLLPAQAMASDTVVLLHGVAKSSRDMAPVENALREAGYETVNIDYPSQDENLDGIARWLRENALTETFWANAETVHFVTHSMGGLVARRYLHVYRTEIPEGKLGRVVMLAPPNRGSEVADLLEHLPPYKWYYGPAGAELTTKTQDGIDEQPWYELGVIAGTREWTYPVAAFVVPGKSDGRVSVERTKIEGMADHTTLPATHTFIMNKKEVHDLVFEFLKNGHFGETE